MEKELASQVDALCSKLIESYKLILKRSRIEDESVQEHEQLQLSTATENIVSYEVLLIDSYTYLVLLFVH